MIELRAGRRHDVIVDTAESLGEALSLARFFTEDPRDPQAPEVIFLWDNRAGQYCGWYRRRSRTRRAQ